MKISELIETARLDELVGVKDRGLNDFKASLKQLDEPYAPPRIMTIRWFVKKLRDDGWQGLGSGAYGSVFTHPNLNYCIKLFSKDPTYLRYVKFCQANSAPCLPKFRGKLMRVDDETFAVRMEHLAPISGKFYKELTFAICEFTSDDHLTAEEYFKQYDADSLIGKYFAQNPDLLATLEKLKTIADPRDWDLGVNNVMLRDDTLVITDPWAE